MKKRWLFSIDEAGIENIKASLVDLAKAANSRPSPDGEKVKALVENSPLGYLERVFREQLSRFEVAQAFDVSNDFQTLSDLVHWREYIQSENDVWLSFLFESLLQTVQFMNRPYDLDESKIDSLLNNIRALALIIKPQIDGVNSQTNNFRIKDKKICLKIASDLLESNPEKYPTINSIVRADEMAKFVRRYSTTTIHAWISEIHPNRGHKGRPRK